MWRITPLIVLVLAIGLAIWWPMGGQHWLAVHTGTVNEPGPYYGFWSGFGSDLGEYVIIGGLGSAIALQWRTHTCHYAWWCWRHPHHKVEDTPYYVCAHHHPSLDVPRSAREAVDAIKETADA